MQQLFKSFLVLLMLTTIVLAGSIRFERPWNALPWSYTNPNIFSFLNYELWNSNEMDKSLEELGLDGIDISNIDNQKVADKLLLAKRNRESASYAKTQCNVVYTTLQVVWPLGSQIAFLIVDEITKRSVTECLNYGVYWRATMNAALDALEESDATLENRWNEMKSRFTEISYAGLCDDDYTGVAKEVCLDAKSQLEGVAGSGIGGIYGTYNRVKNDLNTIQNKVADARPVMEGYRDVVNVIWSTEGPITFAEQMIKNLDEGKQNATAEYTAATRLVLAEKKNAEGSYVALQVEKIEGIYGGAYLEAGVLSGSATSIEDGYKAVGDLLKAGTSEYENAITIYRNGLRGYLKDSFNSMRLALSYYQEAGKQSEEVMENVKKAVRAEREEALSELRLAESIGKGKMWSATAKQAYERANGQVKQGDAAAALGDQFQFYRRAIIEAKLVQYELSSNAGQLEMVLSAEVKKTYDLIRRAKMDGVDVFMEESEYELIKDMRDSWVVEELEKIRDSLLMKAGLQYNYLERMDSDITSLLEKGGGEFDYLLSDYQDIKKNYFPVGRLDYYVAMGNLKTIDNKFTAILQEINNSIDKIVQKNIEVESEIYYGDVALDNPVDITLDVFVTNPLNFQAESIVVEVPVVFEIKENDVVGGRERVKGSAYRNGILQINLKKVEPFETIHLIFMRKIMLAETKMMKRYAFGRGDGDVDITEERTITALVDIPRLWVGECDTAEVDGIGANCEPTIRKGTHTLKRTYVAADAYIVEKQNIRSAQLGFDSKVEYDLLIQSKEDIDRLRIYPDIPRSWITSSNAVSYSGERIDNKIMDGNRLVSFDVLGVRKEGSTDIRISYTTSNAKEYVESEISAIESMDVNESIAEKITAVKKDLVNGSIGPALEKLEKIKDEIRIEKERSWKSEQAYKKVVEFFQKEVDDIDGFLARAEEAGLNSSFIEKLRLRKNMVEEKLNESATLTPTEGLAVLAGLDQNWSRKEITAYRKDMAAEFNTLKARWLKIGGNEELKPLFDEVQTALAKLETTGAIAGVYDSEVAMARLRERIAKGEADADNEHDVLKNKFYAVKTKIDKMMVDYEREYNAARGTTFARLFPYRPNEVDNLADSISNAIDKGNWRVVSERLKKLENKERGVANVIETLVADAQVKYNSLLNIYRNEMEGYGEEDRKKIEQYITAVGDHLEKKEYVKALKIAETAFLDLNKMKKTDNIGLFILAVSAFLILAALAVYLIKNRRVEKKKEFRRLEKIS